MVFRPPFSGGREFGGLGLAASGAGVGAPSVGAVPPARAERFANPVCEPLWAAFLTLPEGDKHLFLEEVQRHLVQGEDRVGLAGTRNALLVGALRECAQALGHSPSIKEYRAYRRETDDRLPPDASIRRWAGGSWNDALLRARLDAEVEPDVLVVDLGPAFTAQEAIHAIRDCAREGGVVPVLTDYLSWARREDVRRRPGRRPRTVAVFQRLFGGWLPALVAAGLESRPGHESPLPDSIQVRHGRGYRWSDEQLADTLRAAARDIGRVPTVQAFSHYRQRRLDAAHAEGKAIALPSYTAFLARYRQWDVALVAAGLEARGGRAVHSIPGRRRGGRRRIPDEEMIAAIRLCWMEIGEPFTPPRYRDWRLGVLARDEAEGRRPRRIPSYHSIWGRFGTWDAAIDAALTLDEDDEENGAPEDEGATPAAS